MKVKLNIFANMRNGEKLDLEIIENDPKGILKDDAGGKREIELTEKDVLIEYTKRISRNIKEKQPIILYSGGEKVFVINPYDVSNFEISALKI